MDAKEKSIARETVEEFAWRFGEAEFDEGKWELKLRGTPVDLEPRPLELLAVLLRHAGEVVTKEELFEAVWADVIVVEKALTNAMGKLRRAIADDQQALIETVHRVGYRLVVPVTRTLVSRRLAPKLDFKPGDAVPRREQWKLSRALDVSLRSEVWLAVHEKTREQRVFKFSPDGKQLSGLKREATLSRVLTETYGERACFVRVLEWNFEEAPYFIECEYGGQNWLEWAAEQGGLAAVPLEQRLELFIQAADAVAAAHGAGVLHKDLKPANLLIEPRKDGSWQVRVTDFGSGRLAEPGRLADLGITQMGFTQTMSLSSDSLSGTLMYLAPEVLAGQAATQASDVFALGVLLHQLVVGDFKRAITPGWERQIEDDFLREDIATAANGNPAERLQTAHELAARVRTIAARASQRQRELALIERETELRNLAERTRLLRPWVIGVGVALVAGVVVSTAFFLRAESARRSAIEETKKAQSAELRTRVINRFLNDDLIAQANPFVSGRKDVTVLDAILKATAVIDERFRSQPDVAGEIELTLGDAFLAIGDAGRAEAQFAKALQISDRQHGPGDSATLISGMRQIEALAIAGKPDSAGEKLEQIAIRIASQEPADTRMRMLAAYTQSVIDQAHADYQAAKKSTGEVLALAAKLEEAAPGVTAIDEAMLLQTRIIHGFYMAQTDEREAAEKEFRALVAELGQTRGNSDPSMLQVKQYLAQTLLLEKPWEEDPARNSALLEEARSILLKIKPQVDAVLGPVSNLAKRVIGEIGETYEAVDDWPRAIEYYKQMYDINFQRFGDANIKTVISMNTIGGSYEREGNLTEAIKWLRKARQYGEPLANPNFKQLMDYQLSRMLLGVGDCAEAQPLVANLQTKAVNLTEPRKDWPAKLELIQGQLEVCRGEFVQAEATIADSLKNLLVIFQDGGWTVDQARLWLGYAKEHHRFAPPVRAGAKSSQPASEKTVGNS